jgi:hypothetical protein
VIIGFVSLNLSISNFSSKERSLDGISFCPPKGSSAIIEGNHPVKIICRINNTLEMRVEFVKYSFYLHLTVKRDIGSEATYGLGHS